jgi:sialate O-acetylesterase
LRISTVGESRELTDVLVGEVWLCAGQSNMEWPLARELHAEAELPRALHPGIRFFNPGYAGKGASGSLFAAEEVAMLTPSDYYRGAWEVCTPGSAARMSAIGYYAARDLHVALGVPVGIIHLAVGGSPTEAWVSRKTLAEDGALRALTEGDWLVNPALEAWCRQRGQENLGQAPAGGVDGGGPNHPFKPGFLWVAGIEPLLPLGLRGVMWYQGESNSLSLARVRQHELLLPLLVSDWRRGWGRPDLPFLYCQLSGIDSNPYRSEFWPEFRDSQRRLLEIIPYSGMVVTADVGNRTDVHPRDKATVGVRLASLALARVYGRELEFSGPQPKSALVRGSEIVVTFRHATGGLRTGDGQALRGFEIAAADDGFTPASGIIDGKTVLISYQAGFVPRRIRYGWQPFPEGNLQNYYSLPASTFMLDVGVAR